MMRRLPLILIAILLLTCQRPGAAQQNVYVGTPLVNVNESFYEWFGIDWGYQSRKRNGSFFFNRGSSQGTIPPFGGFDPASAARIGFSGQSGNQSFFFNLTAAQGSNRTITSSTPSVTFANGAVGSIRDVQQRPFVTGLIPVVGSGGGPGYRVRPPTLISPLKQRLARLRAEQQQQQPPLTPPAPPAVAPVANDKQGKLPAPALVLGPNDATASLNPGGSTRGEVSTAERGDISVAEIRERQAAELQAQADELDRLVEEAQSAEDVGRFGAARVRYRQAAARATGERQRVLLQRLEAIRDR